MQSRSSIFVTSGHLSPRSEYPRSLPPLAGHEIMVPVPPPIATGALPRGLSPQIVAPLARGQHGIIGKATGRSPDFTCKSLDFTKDDPLPRYTDNGILKQSKIRELSDMQLLTRGAAIKQRSKIWVEKRRQHVVEMREWQELARTQGEYTRAFDALQRREREGAVQIQSIVRGWLQRRRWQPIIGEYREHNRRVAAAVKVQRAWRRAVLWWAGGHASEYQRQRSARRLQRAFRLRLVRRNFYMKQLLREAMASLEPMRQRGRASAATTIQAHVRRRAARKLAFDLRMRVFCDTLVSVRFLHALTRMQARHRGKTSRRKGRKRAANATRTHQTELTRSNRRD